MSTALVSSYKRFTIDLTSTYTDNPTYTLSNDGSVNMYCHLSFFLTTTESNNVTIDVAHYNGFSPDHSDTYIMNKSNNEFDKIIRLYTDSAIVTISYTSFTGTLFGIICKNTEKDQQMTECLNNTGSGHNKYLGPINEPTNFDVFNRLRVSEPYTLFDAFNRYTISEEFSTYTDASSNISLDADSSLSLNCGDYATSMVIRESKYVFTYQPGKSLLFMSSFTMNTLQSNLIQRVGYFGPSNGIFLEASGTTINFVKRSQGVDTQISQANWNGTQLLGDAPDSITLDVTKSQILWIDIQWLGVGNVRCGFKINGKSYTCHTFYHANNITGTYMATACLPVRYEIRNIADSLGAGTLKQICTSVQSESGFEGSSIIRYQGTDNTLKALLLQNTFYPIVSIKLKSDRLDGIVTLAQLSIVNSVTNSLLQYKILLNATLTSPTFTNYDLSSNVMYDTTASSYTGGTTIHSGLFNQGNAITLGSSKDFNLQIGRSLTSDTTYASDIITVVVSCLTGNNPAIGCLLGWYELI